METKRGALAYCSLGYLGIITSHTPQIVVYPDGTEGTAWVGIQLTDGPNHNIGDYWCSRNPRVLDWCERPTAE